MKELSNDIDLISAAQIREMTLTKEEKFQREKTGFVQSLMGAIVNQATQNGNLSYTANVNPAIDSRLLEETMKTFQDLGYTVTNVLQNADKIGDFYVLTISWKDTSNETTAVVSN